MYTALGCLSSFYSRKSTYSASREWEKKLEVTIGACEKNKNIKVTGMIQRDDITHKLDAEFLLFSFLLLPFFSKLLLI